MYWCFIYVLTDTTLLQQSGRDLQKWKLVQHPFSKYRVQYGITKRSLGDASHKPRYKCKAVKRGTYLCNPKLTDHLQCVVQHQADNNTY